MHPRPRLLVALLALVLASLAPAPPAIAAEATFHLRGTVSAEVPVEGGWGIEVRQGGARVASVHSDDGTFDLLVPAGGPYVVVAFQNGGRQETYAGAPRPEDGDPIYVTDHDVQLGAWVLPRLHHVCGRVQADRWVTDLPVLFFPAGPGTDPYPDSKAYFSGAHLDQFCVDLPQGTWRMLVDAQGVPAYSTTHARYASRWYGDAPSYSEARSFTVTGDTTLPTPITLTAGGQVTGLVTDAATGLPLRKIDIEALDADGQVVSRAVTGSDGRYVVPRVAAGTHRVRVVDALGGRFVPQTSGPLQVSDGTAVGAPTTALVAVPAGTPDLAGTVVDQDGVAEQGVEVEAWPATCTTDDPDATATTGLDGRFSFTGLTAASYVLRYRDDHGTLEDEVDDDFELGTQWSGGAERCHLATAQPLGSTTADAQMIRNGGLAGTITTERGERPLGAEVWIYSASGFGSPYSYRVARADSSWSFGDVPPGEYTIEFRDSWGDYEWSWWSDDAATQEEATRVSVQPGVMTNGFDGHAFNPVRNEVLPVVSGDPVVGSTLTVSDGSWFGRVTRFEYTWLAPRDGTWTPVGTGQTYVVQPADLGQGVEARVRAFGPDGAGGAFSDEVGPVTVAPATPPSQTPAPLTPAPVQSAPTTTPALAPSTTTAEATARRTKVVVRVAVSAPGGTVTVTEGGRVRGSAAVVDGRVVLRLDRPRRGRHTWTVTWTGTSTAAPSATTVKVRGGR